MGRKLKKTLAVAAAAAVVTSALPLGAALNANAAIIYEPTRTFSPVYRTRGDVLEMHDALIERFYPNDKEYETSLREDVINYYRWLGGLNNTKTMTLDFSIPDTVVDEINSKWQTDGLTDHTAYNGMELGGSISSADEVDLFFTKTATKERFTTLDMMRALINDDTQPHNYRQAILSRNATHIEMMCGNPPASSGIDACTGVVAVGYVNNNTGKNAVQYNMGFYSDKVSAWPSAGAFPVEEIDPDARWSVGWDTGRQGYYTDESDIFVRIKNLDTGEIYERTMGNGLSLDTTCGAMLTFDAPSDKDYTGKNYSVYVGGLKRPATSGDSAISYQVNFMTYDDVVIDDVHEPYDLETYLYTPPEDYALAEIPFTKEYNIYNANNPTIKYYFRRAYSDKWQLLQSGSSTTLNYTFSPEQFSFPEMADAVIDEEYPILPDSEAEMILESDYTDTFEYDDFAEYDPGEGVSSIRVSDSCIRADLIVGGKVVDSKLTKLNICDPTEISISTESSYKLGYEVNIFATATGASCFCNQYKGDFELVLSYKKSGDPDGSYIQMKKTEDDLYYTFTPTQTGEYDIKAEMTNVISRYVRYDSESNEDIYEPVKTLESTNTVVISVTDKSVKNASRLSAPAGQPGETVEIFGGGEYGAAPYNYQYFYRRQGARVWNSIAAKDVSFTARKARFTPKAYGAYEFKVIAIDASTPNETDEAILTYYVTEPLVNDSALSAKRVAPGTMITFYGRASGGSGDISYLYSYKRKTARTWTNMGGANTAFLTLRNVGEYDAKITAVDSVGNRTEKTFSVTVTNELVNETTLNVKLGAPLGERIIVNTAAKGGAGNYSYTTKYNRVGSRTWVTLQGTAFRPSVKGVYNIVNTVTDGAGAVQEVTFTIQVVDPVTNNSTLSSTKAGTPEYPAGTRFTVNGSATGGSGDQSFVYYYKRTAALYWTILPAGTVTLRNAGTYQFKSVAVDPSGLETEKVFDVTIK